MEFVDSHCHPHFDAFQPIPEQIVKNAQVARVNRLIAVGTTLADSERALSFAQQHKQVWASVGVHPHDASPFVKDKENLKKLSKLSNSEKVVAIGEIGLDYYRSYSAKNEQQKALRAQIEAGITSGLPYIFHIREAWEDFWPIFDSYKNLHGVVHSFSTTPSQLEQALSRGLYIGLNGIMTFTKDNLQLESAKLVPLNRLLLETDAPFLAPKPFRGSKCEPKYIIEIAKFLAQLRTENISDLATATTNNAISLFSLENSK